MANIRRRDPNPKLIRRAPKLAANAEKELTVTAISFSTAQGRALYLDSVAPREALRGLREANYAVRFGGRDPLVVTAATLTDLVGIIEIIVEAFWSLRAYVGFWWRDTGMTHEESREWHRENRAMSLRIWPHCEA